MHSTETDSLAEESSSAGEPAQFLGYLPSRSSRMSDRDLSLLVDATRLFSESLEVETTLAAVARLFLPQLGSWCLVDIVENGEWRRIAVIHPDPRLQSMASDLHGWPPVCESVGSSVAQSCGSEVVCPVTDEMLVDTARSPEDLAILRALDVGSYMRVPIVAHGVALGAITYVGSRRIDPFPEHDRILAEDVANRCAIVIDNARLLQDLNDARMQAEEANLVKMRFLSTMSHELRTPLNAIAGYSELLATGVRGDLSPAQLADVQRIQANQRHLLGLVESMLGYAKVDAGCVEFGLENVSVASVIVEVEKVICPLAESRGIDCIGFRADEQNDLEVYADREKMHRILINLSANAIKFSREGGKVEISSERTGDRVHIRVSDNGIGIAPGDLERIFEPFVQVDESLTRRRGGTGLGLAISRDLASGMNGDISVESRLGVGSVFTLSLPVGHPA